jgi:hypothetical protein
MQFPPFRILAFCCLLPVAAAAQEANTSKLWGAAGELWSPESRLPDFSFAGYMCGEQPIPDVPVVKNARDLGIVGDGVTDDAPALQKAIDSTEKGALFLPEGRYVLGSPVTINKGYFVLRGAGIGKTVLVIPKSLGALQDENPPANPKDKVNFSFTGGFISIRGEDQGKRLAALTKTAPRGSRELELDAPPKLKPGDFLTLRMADPGDHTLGKYVHGDAGLDAGPQTYKEYAQKPWVTWAARVEKLTGPRLTLDRPLRLDARPEWQAEIWNYAPSLTHIGIEGLSFEFPGVPKKYHLGEEGFNAIDATALAHSWFRDLSFIDADNGINLKQCRFMTIERTTFLQAKREKMTGHHALWATSATQDCLFSEFDFQTRYEHDLTVEGRANGNVFRNGRGIFLCIDHHRNMPYENLFTNLTIDNPGQAFRSSGTAARGPHSAVRATFWNLRSDKPNWPKDGLKATEFPLANLIGVGAYPPATDPAAGQWIEPVQNLQPADLYRAQMDRRRAGK